jgi:DNA-binding transcriptional regulator YiaG
MIMAHHYKESGLDNVYLENGYKAIETPYGTGMAVQNTDGLHKAIGLWLVAQPIPLNGAELRFLRIEMELTQRDLAGILGAKEQTLRIWERGRGKPIPGPADRLLRAIYSEFVTGDGSVRRLVDRLAHLDQRARSSARLRDTPNGWQVEAHASRHRAP